MAGEREDVGTSGKQCFPFPDLRELKVLIQLEISNK
jgi:hypothetical protein